MLKNKGFTLIELIISMVLFMVVIGITGSAFKTIISNSRKLTSSEESNIEGVVGLEIFRHDMRQMGWGLTGDFCKDIEKVAGVCPTVPTYSEASVSPAQLLNDAPSGVPRQVVSWNNYSGAAVANGSDSTKYGIIGGSDYLGLKAISLSRATASQKWTYLNYSAGGKSPNRWGNAIDNIPGGSRVIMLRRDYTYYSDHTSLKNILIFDKADPSTYWVNYPSSATGMFATAFSPKEKSEIYTVYGVDDANLRMPFNRADYFVSRPSDTSKIPTSCAPGTGILYKATVNHADGKLNYMPILDCVADMQIVFGWDLNGNGVYDESTAYSSDATKISVSSASGATSADIKAAMEDPAGLRDKLKYIKVYIMAQEGRKDMNYTNTAKIVVGDLESLTRGYDVAALTSKNWLNYRWKVYRINIKNPSAN